MNAEDLYDKIKASMKFFGLSWAEMNAMHFNIHGNKIVFRYGNDTITFEVPNDQ